MKMGSRIWVSAPRLPGPFDSPSYEKRVNTEGGVILTTKDDSGTLVLGEVLNAVEKVCPDHRLVGGEDSRVIKMRRFSDKEVWAAHLTRYGNPNTAAKIIPMLNPGHTFYYGRDDNIYMHEDRIIEIKTPRCKRHGAFRLRKAGPGWPEATAGEIQRAHRKLCRCSEIDRKECHAQFFTGSGKELFPLYHPTYSGSESAVIEWGAKWGGG